MSFVVSLPPPKHSCNPGWVEKNGYFDNFGAFVPAGTVVGCTCGKTYVAYYDTRPNQGHVSLAAKWRLESRIKRWLRERQTELNIIKQEMPGGWEPPFARLNLEKPEVDEF